MYNLLDKTYNIKENLLFDITSNTKIYRIIPLKYFLEMLDTKHLLFKKPELWDDPYENFISKESFLDENNRTVDFNIDMLYAQCWTYNPECDGMWRNYASLESGVKIETTVELLLEVLKAKEEHDTNYYVGKVCYEKQEGIIDFLNDDKFVSWLTSKNHQILAEILCMKRDEFSYEKEVRAMILDFDSKEDILKVEFNPLELINKIEFAPKTSDCEFNCLKDMLITKYRINKSKISRSTLYDKIEL